MEPELTELYLGSLNRSAISESAYGVRELVGSIYQMTISESGRSFLIKGGSWFSQDPQQECQAWRAQMIKAGETRLDVGFRCVMPVWDAAAPTA